MEATLLQAKERKPMARKRSFSYELEQGRVTRIGVSETKKFLTVGRIPTAGKDRSLSAEAISNIDKAYTWPNTFRPKREKSE